MEHEYVEAFFLDGSLRLSSFARFRQHKDEQRLDSDEGVARFFHRTSEQGGQTIMATIIHGVGTYVLCASAIYDQRLATAFRSASCIQINNSTEFAIAVSRHVPGFVAGLEGACIYQGLRAFDRDMGGVIPVQQLTDGGGKIDPSKVQATLTQKIEHWPLFLKSMRYRNQSEYRFIWKANSHSADYLDVKVPEAREFCSRPSALLKKRPKG